MRKKYFQNKKMYSCICGEHMAAIEKMPPLEGKPQPVEADSLGAWLQETLHSYIRLDTCAQTSGTSLVGVRWLFHFTFSGGAY